MQANKAREWIDLFEQRTDIGLTQRGFCEKHGLSYNAFRHWRSRLGFGVPARVESGNEEPGFIEIELPPTSTTLTKAAAQREILTVELPNGVVLRFASR